MYFVICFIMVMIDQIVKKFCLENLSYSGSVQIIKNFFSLTYVENRGAAFGMLEGGRILFVLIAVLAICICIFYFFKIQKNRFEPIYKMSLALIISGSIGNLIDRVFRGFVVDMFHFTFFGKDFAVFNCADVFIVVGTFLLSLTLIYDDLKNKNKQV